MNILGLISQLIGIKTLRLTSYISVPLGESNVSRRKSLCGTKLQEREKRNFFPILYLCLGYRMYNKILGRDRIQ